MQVHWCGNLNSGMGMWFSRKRVSLVLAAGLALGTFLTPGDAAAYGNKNCGEGLVCLLSCPPNDVECSYSCGQDLTVPGAELFANLQICLLPMCPGVPPAPVCVLQAGLGECAADYQACINDGDCAASCLNKACGDDGCGGSCGDCPPGLSCDAVGQCSPCQADCAGKSCGDNGCGGSCGECPGGMACINFVCSNCSPNCVGLLCGDDGCGGSCGECGYNYACQAGQCVPCTPQCDGKQCGDNGCGGLCGTCGDGWKCTDGVCIEDGPCTPSCLNKECGGNGCGGMCGTCGMEQKCSPGGLCVDKDTVFEIVVDEPDVIYEEDSPWVPNGEDARADSNGKGSGNDWPAGTCPEGSTYYFGQCLPVEDEGGGSGCSMSSTAAGPSPWLLLLLCLAGLSALCRNRNREIL